MNGPVIQDWETVVLKRKPTQSEAERSGITVAQEKFGGNKNVQETSTTGIASSKKIENEEVAIPFSTVELGKQIQTARLKKKITQSELDKKCNLPVNTTQKYENGTAIVNSAQLQKMSKILGVQIKAPKKQKLAEQN